MSLPAPYRSRPLRQEDLRDVLTLDAWAFPTPHSVDDLANLPSPLDWTRTFGVERDGTAGLAAMFGTYPLRSFPVPGAEVPCGFLTWVGVHPGHRRRGILSAMIDAHFADDRAHGESISALFASEPGIYGRFGYGSAATQVSLSLDRGASLRPVAGSSDLEVELASWDPARHGSLVAGLHRDYARLPEGLGRPGWATWETPGLRSARDADPALLREGKEPRRLLLVRGAAGEPVGYATFHRSDAEDRTGPAGVVTVRDAVALTPAAAHRLWRTLLDLDLTAVVQIRDLPLDDPLLSLLVDLRRARADYQDNIWVRILDLPTALAQRRYAADVDVVLEVTDARLPNNAGRWRVRARAWEHAEVVRSDAPADLTLDIRELGAAHLGSTSLAALAQAGLVDAASGDMLARAAAAWSWPIAAGANWVF